MKEQAKYVLHKERNNTSSPFIGNKQTALFELLVKKPNLYFHFYSNSLGFIFYNRIIKMKNRI